MINIIINIFIVIAMGCVCLISRRIQKTWFAPGSFFALIWFIHMAFTVVFASDYYLYFNSNFIILFYVFIVILGSTIGMRLKIRRTSINTVNLNSINKLMKLSLVVSIVGFLSFPAILYSTGGSFSTLLNLDAIMNLARQNSISRYSGDLQNSTLTSILLSINYFAAIVNGVSIVVEKNASKGKYNKRLMLHLLPIITSILIAAILTTKATILYTVILFLGGIITANESLNDRNYLFTRKNIFRGIILIPTIIFLFVFIQMSRYGFNDIDGMFRVIKVFKVWAFGHMPAFSVWFNDYYLNGDYSLSYGQYTFSGVFSILNIAERVSGVYSEGAYISNNYEATNIFTIFRGLIEDFGLIGSMLLSFVGSIFLGTIYKSVKLGKLNSFVFLIMFYSFSMFGFVISILAYNSILLAFILFYILTTIFTFPSKVSKVANENKKTMNNYLSSEEVLR
ncbi:O-antigen polymerase [Mesobacillus selenatarsenatis]|uniref:Oligosaccharide repeat unit polymerase n=1 Tax=Mesobacillus selenatarsenatis TaxID=388741 RepID=A0A846TEU1_9BACI|nr:O-antigen polymerase [Mesobacillus selenatarsenatis]NKE04704.1 oligosaccharide repeat unit polymerase [Mesobacillus selenatarsenatis]